MQPRTKSMSFTADNTTMLVWDKPGLPPEGWYGVVLWRGFTSDGRMGDLSILQEVEDKAESLRERYLAWIYDLGEMRIEGERLVDRLSVRKDFSYWWMTLLVEKSYDKSASMYDAIKLIALEDIVKERTPEQIVLASGNAALVRAFRLWCRRAGLKFEWRRVGGSAGSTSLAKLVFRKLPRPLQAAAHLLRWVVERWPLRRNGTFARSSADVTIVDYLVHLPSDALAGGRFASNYWAGLVDLLRGEGAGVNWLHHYVPHDSVPSVQKAVDMIACFNDGEPGRIQRHACLDAALSISVIAKTLRDYRRVIAMGWRARKARNAFGSSGSNVDLWPLFEADWRDSMYGATAILNCLFLNLLERVVGKLPHQKLGLYLLENQGWERAFIHAWRAAGHGRLVGVQHATVRFWDLRYFHDARSYVTGTANAMPAPDFFAVNGPASMAACLRGGCPEERVVEVEALRYLYLSDLVRKAGVAREGAREGCRVLVFGDYVPSVNRRQMRALAEAKASLPTDTSFVVRPHPACAFDSSNYPSLNLTVSASPLPDLLGECDVAFAGHITSAAVDAYIAGLPVVTLLDGGEFNMSPLRGLEGVKFVSSTAELVRALNDAAKERGGGAKVYYCIDRRLGRWRRLLNANACNVVRNDGESNLVFDKGIEDAYERDIRRCV